ncbi:hypothetical protein HYW55_01260 [Candidatus Gottesmanbacteria bacterium]|nr:hypothetical protein [Candidatus Gottesmanbacteria bacterium]
MQGQQLIIGIGDDAQNYEIVRINGASATVIISEWLGKSAGYRGRKKYSAGRIIQLSGRRGSGTWNGKTITIFAVETPRKAEKIVPFEEVQKVVSLYLDEPQIRALWRKANTRTALAAITAEQIEQLGVNQLDALGARNALHQAFGGK